MDVVGVLPQELAFVLFEKTAGSGAPGMDGAKTAARSFKFPDERTKAVTLPKSFAKNDAPAGRNQGEGGEFRESTGDFTAASAVRAIA